MFDTEQKRASESSDAKAAAKAGRLNEKFSGGTGVLRRVGARGLQRRIWDGEKAAGLLPNLTVFKARPLSVLAASQEPPHPGPLPEERVGVADAKGVCSWRLQSADLGETNGAHGPRKHSGQADAPYLPELSTYQTLTNI